MLRMILAMTWYVFWCHSRFQHNTHQRHSAHGKSEDQRTQAHARGSTADQRKPLTDFTLDANLSDVPQRTPHTHIVSCYRPLFGSVRCRQADPMTLCHHSDVGIWGCCHVSVTIPGLRQG